MKGILKKWVRNFGFIRCGEIDVYVPLRNYADGHLPEVDQLLEFDLQTVPDRSPIAVNVRVLKDTITIRFEQRQLAEQAIRQGIAGLGAG